MSESSTIERVLPVGLDDLEPVDLDELNAQAALLTRVDRKYVVTPAQLDRLVPQLDPRTRILRIDGRTLFGYESTYFDTALLDSYRSAATKRRRRFKVRTRTYLDSGECWLEVKTRGARRATVKTRERYEPGSGPRLTDDGLRYVSGQLATAGVRTVDAAQLRAAVTTRFHRRTLWLPEDGARVTIDADLTVDDGRRCLDFPGIVILETKSGASPSAVDRLLWSDGVRPARVSKFGVGMAALHPSLPANRWHRVIREHFTPHRIQPDERSTS